MRKLVYIERLVIAVLLLLLLALAPAKAQNVVYMGQTTALEVEQNEFDTYTWELFDDPTVNFATATGESTSAPYAEFVGANSGTAVQVLWKQAGTYFFRVTAIDAAGCAKNLKIGMMKVLNSIPTAIIDDPDPAGVCAGAEVSLVVTFTGTGPWDFTYNDGTTTSSIITVPVGQNPFTLTIDPQPIITTNYKINWIKDFHGENTDDSNTVEQIVHPLPLPTNIYHR